ncbi:Ornithine aminotransferase [Plasmodiophora brassicae]|uniref:Uncharacterized protein n=1 Tax=Plasmodiophora brassicae TaxID=37360 RepID=A0A0G4IP53_PLABS|nr:hypothetical protein PBRA_005677 [Plasmodiophora brassicae]SPR01053.1 unnamed protein product [Plasmodiophora brassicae]
MNADIVLVFTQRLEHFQGMLPGMGSSSSTPSVVYITLTCSPDDFRQFKGDYESGSVRVECTVFADTAYSLSVAKAEYMMASHVVIQNVLARYDRPGPRVPRLDNVKAMGGRLHDHLERLICDKHRRARKTFNQLGLFAAVQFRSDLMGRFFTKTLFNVGYYALEPDFSRICLPLNITEDDLDRIMALYDEALMSVNEIFDIDRFRRFPQTHREHAARRSTGPRRRSVRGGAVVVQRRRHLHKGTSIDDRDA